jgi:hypothetical protein
MPHPKQVSFSHEMYNDKRDAVRVKIESIWIKQKYSELFNAQLSRLIKGTGVTYALERQK